jgi:Clostridial binary toxin A.
MKKLSDADIAAVVVRSELQPLIAALKDLSYPNPGHKGRPDQVGGSLPRDENDRASASTFKMFDNADSIREWKDDHRYDLIPKLTAKQKDRLDQYKRSSLYHKPLNDYLRTGKYDKAVSGWKNTKEMQAAIKDIDAALVKTQIPENITVFRGMPSEMMPEDAVGVEFRDDGYGSTSLDYKMAEKFARWTREDGFTPALVEIRVPKGTDGIFMDELWDNGESEILLPRGVSYRVISDVNKPVVGIDGGIRYLVAEIMK